MDLPEIYKKIYIIRGVKVMLDFYIASIYGIETKRLKETVRRNIKRFEGEDFMFELTKNECNSLIITLRSQNTTLDVSWFRYSPFAFTELGVAMLCSVLNSDTAIEVNKNIMRAFVAVRHIMLLQTDSETKELQHELKQLKQYIDDIFTNQNDINETAGVIVFVINWEKEKFKIQEINMNLATIENQQ
jgi:hypothetical protein